MALEMLNACIDNTTDTYSFVLLVHNEGHISYVSHTEFGLLHLCHEIKSAEWFKSYEDALNARDALSKCWNIGAPFRVAKYYMIKEVLCLL